MINFENFVIKISFIIFCVTGVFIFFLNSTKSYAIHSPQDHEMAVKFGSDNGNTEWQVAYKYWFDDAIGQRKSTSTWKIWVDSTSNLNIPALNHTFDRVSYLDVLGTSGMGPRFQSWDDRHHPPYKIQWGTTCIDPKERAIYSTAVNDPTYRIYLFTPDITYRKSAANNSGRRVAYAYGNEISSRTDQCPFDCTPNTTCGNNQCGYNIPAGCGQTKDCGYDRCSNNQKCDNNKCTTHYACNHTTGNCSADKDGGSTNENSCNANCAKWNPDLDIVEFTYPGGQVGSNVQASVKIKNKGHYDVDKNFKIRIDNGINATPRTQTLLVDIGNTPLNAGVSRTFTFPATSLPDNVAIHYANALADSENVIEEENNWPNDATDKYEIKENRSDIGGFIYLDTNLSGTLDADDPPYSSTLTNTSGLRVYITPTGNDAITNLTTGAYNITNNVENTYTVRVDTNSIANPLQQGEILIFPANNQISVNLGATDATRKNFLISPARHSIQLGAIVDTDPLPGHKNAVSDSAPNNKVDEVYFPSDIAINLKGPNQPASGSNHTITSGAPLSITGLVVGSYDISLANADPDGYTNVYPNGNLFEEVRVGRGNSNCLLTLTTFTQATCNNGNLSNLLFGFQNDITPWYQAVGGDVRQRTMANTNEASNVNSCPAPNATTYYTSVNSPTLKLNDPGIVYNGAGSNPEKTNSKNWVVKDNYYKSTIRTSYSYLNNLLVTKGRLGTLNASTLCGAGGTANCVLNKGTTTKGIYTSNDLTINTGTTFDTDGDYIFLVNGNLIINDNIIVSPGTTVIFAVSGNITVMPSVTNLQGFYSAGVNFIANSNNADVDPDADVITIDTLLTIQGSVVAGAQNSGGNLFTYRNLGARQTDGNKVCPAVKFVYRPDFVLNAPEAIKATNTSIREVNASSASLPPTPTLPQVTFTSSATSVDNGGTVTLTWRATNALSCSPTAGAASGFSTNGKTEGSKTTSGLTTTTAFILKCDGVGGSITTPTINVQVKPKIDSFDFIPYNATGIKYNSKPTLRWQTTGATSCFGTNFTFASSLVDGSTPSTANQIADMYSYTLSCSNTAGNVTSTIQVPIEKFPGYSTTGDNSMISASSNTNAVRKNNGTNFDWLNRNIINGTGANNNYIQARKNDGTTNGGPLTPPTSPSPEVEYSICFNQTGVYRVYFRGSGPDNSSDQIAVGLNGATAAQENNVKIYTISSPPDWLWTRRNNDNSDTKITVNKIGLNTLSIWAREIGARVDRIYLDSIDHSAPYFSGDNGAGPAINASTTCMDTR